MSSLRIIVCRLVYGRSAPDTDEKGRGRPQPGPHRKGVNSCFGQALGRHESRIGLAELQSGTHHSVPFLGGTIAVGPPRAVRQSPVTTVGAFPIVGFCGSKEPTRWLVKGVCVRTCEPENRAYPAKPGHEQAMSLPDGRRRPLMHDDVITERQGP